MSTSADYGGWALYAGDTNEPRDVVLNVVAEFKSDFDVEGLTKAWVAAINARLPEGVSLRGREFYGPYPWTPEVGDQIREVIQSTELEPLMAAYDTTDENSSEHGSQA